MTVAQRLHRRLDNEVRGAEIRLADAEIDDVAALRDQGIGAGEHRKSIFLADAVESRDRFQHGVGSPGEFAGSSPDRERKIKLGGGQGSPP